VAGLVFSACGGGAARRLDGPTGARLRRPGSCDEAAGTFGLPRGSDPGLIILEEAQMKRILVLAALATLAVAVPAAAQDKPAAKGEMMDKGGMKKEGMGMKHHRMMHHSMRHHRHHRMMKHM
jgi:hypothetical protein